MEIRLKESELKQAVRLWIENEGFSLCDKRVEIDFTAGRAPNGFSAEVETFNTPPEAVAPEATTTAPVQTPEPEPEVSSDDSSPFIEDDDQVDGNQQALDLDLD